MERIEVVARAAAGVRERYWPASESTSESTSEAGKSKVIPAATLTARLCEALDLELQVSPAAGVMLGGAFSRLQLWAWEQPELGGNIWLRDDLDAETRVFAIAHELGHYALHRGEGIGLRPACDQHEVDQQANAGSLRTEERRVEEYTPRARRELEANAFAAELLAPCAEVRRLFTGDRAMDAARLAMRYGISRTLAQRRLVDAVLVSTAALRAGHGAPHPAERAASAATTASPTDLLTRLDPMQREAACVAGPALVIAGPGSGKTATLVGRAAYLVGERAVPPERVLALTFSNRAAAEMRERLVASGLPGERMPVMTTHAFAAALLREYASRAPHADDEPELQADFRILDEANAFLLMEDLLTALPLRYYRSLGNPTAHLRALLADFSQARDALLTPSDYLALVEAMPLAPESQPEPSVAGKRRDKGGKGSKRDKAGKPQPPEGTFTAEQIAKARERAAAYGVWDRALRQRGLVDFGGLIQRAVELLCAAPDALAEIQGRFPHLLVDEFQDTNHAAAELLMQIAGASGSGLWVVGDRNQSIYRFRGASPGNLFRLVEHYPDLRVRTLRRCYRSVPAIVQLGSAMAARMAALLPATPAGGERGGARPDGAPNALAEATRPQELEPVRPDGAHPAILRCESFANAIHECVGLATAIERRHARGVAYGEQAVLCRTHKQAREMSAALTACGVPVGQSGDLFALTEIKDALAFMALAAGPDARGLLRGAALLMGLGYPPPAGGELATAARALAQARLPLPGALTRLDTLDLLDGATPLTATTRAGLRALGSAATALRNGVSVGEGLSAFLLRPGGYAWQLARVADGLDAPARLRESEDAVGQDGRLPGTASPMRAQAALAALGELARLASRFDLRWAREPDFRALLSRAVTHRRATQPVATDAADTVEPAPAADVARSTTPTEGLNTRGETRSAVPLALAVRCCLRYLDALQATNIAAPAGEADAVHILTAHQSKGLEFPVIYLPGLAQGRFPVGATAPEEVCPPGFRESDAPGEREAEERCLFYVGVTRARDCVVITRAQTYGKAAQPSPLLALVDGAPPMPAMPAMQPLLPDDEIRSLLDVATSLAHEEEDAEGETEDETAKVAQAHMGPSSADVAQKPIFHLRELEQYLACPLQYKYTRRYELLDPAEDAVHRFHRYIRRGASELRELHTSAPAAEWPAAAARLKALWETAGPAGHAYDAFYWQRAEEILRAEWKSITAPGEATAQSQVLLAQPLHATLRRCTVEVTADRVVSGLALLADTRSTPAPTLLVRLHTGRPHAADETQDLTLPLYYLAHQQLRPDVPVKIALAYVGDALTDAEPETDEPGADEPSQSYLVDVTENARKVAEKYMQPDRKQRSALDKLDEAAVAILAGRFAARPEERRCAACAYCHICPADPDGERTATTAAPIAGRQLVEQLAPMAD